MATKNPAKVPTNQPKKSNRPGTRLGTQLRGQVAAAYGLRGHGAADLFLDYSWKSKKDVILMGKTAHLNFLLSEFDPSVSWVDYEVKDQVGKHLGTDTVTHVHAVVHLRSGETVWRSLVREEPAEDHPLQALKRAIAAGTIPDVAQVEIWTEDRLVANPLKLRNALRVHAWIAAARYWPLETYKQAVLRHVQKRAVSFEEVVALGEGTEPLYGAAVLELACTGVLRSDLCESPLTALTQFTKVEVAHGS